MVFVHNSKLQHFNRLTHAKTISHLKLRFFVYSKVISAPSINPLVPSTYKIVLRIAKISIPKLEGIVKKNSYERRVYESVAKR